MRRSLRRVTERITQQQAVDLLDSQPLTAQMLQIAACAPVGAAFLAQLGGSCSMCSTMAKARAARTTFSFTESGNLSRTGGSLA